MCIWTVQKEAFWRMQVDWIEKQNKKLLSNHHANPEKDELFKNVSDVNLQLNNTTFFLIALSEYCVHMRRPEKINIYNIIWL